MPNVDLVPSGQAHWGLSQQSPIAQAARIALQLPPPPPSVPPLLPPGGHAPFKLGPSFTVANVVHAADLKHAICDAVTVPAQMFAHCDCAVAAGAPHVVAFDWQLDVQSAVEIGGSDPVPFPPVPPDELLDEHAAISAPTMVALTSFENVSVLFN